jgi:hypothetical protein
MAKCISKHIRLHICWTIKRAQRYRAVRDAEEVREQSFQFALGLQSRAISQQLYIH